MRLDEYAKEVESRSWELTNEWDKRAIEWDLNKDSIVWEIGAYRGRWALQIARKYNPNLYCFEPQKWAFDVCEYVLQNYKKASVFHYGLGMSNKIALMTNYETDGCSFIIGEKNDSVAYCNMCDIWDIYSGLKTKQIDLMMINIEGCEHTLLPYMFAYNIFPQNFMVQLHGELEEIAQIRKYITEYYKPVWDYGNTLSAWKLKA